MKLWELESNLQDFWKKLGVVAHACNPNSVLPASLAELFIFRTQEEPFNNNNNSNNKAAEASTHKHRHVHMHRTYSLVLDDLNHPNDMT